MNIAITNDHDANREIYGAFGGAAELIINRLINEA